MTYTALRTNLAETMEKVCDDHSPVVITRQKSRPVVMMSLEDYHSIEATLYLMRSPANAKDLMEAIAEIEAGEVIHVETLPE